MGPPLSVYSCSFFFFLSSASSSSHPGEGGVVTASVRVRWIGTKSTYVASRTTRRRRRRRRKREPFHAFIREWEGIAISLWTRRTNPSNPSGFIFVISGYGTSSSSSFYHPSILSFLFLPSFPSFHGLITIRSSSSSPPSMRRIAASTFPFRCL